MKLIERRDMQSKNGSLLYSKNSMNDVVNMVDKIIKDAPSIKNKIEEFMEYTDQLDLTVGDRKGDSEEDSIKKRQAVLDELNEVIEREAIVDNESKAMLNCITSLKEGIEELRRDLRMSAEQISSREYGILDEMARLDKLTAERGEILRIKSTGVSRKKEIDDMKKRVSDIAKRVGVKKVDSTKMTYEEYLEKRKGWIEYTNVCFNKRDRKRYRDNIPDGVNILETVNVLGKKYGCFENCTSLSTICIPTSVSRICGNCFSDCSKLSAVSIPTSVSVLGKKCFNNCFSLSSITIPSSVSTIGGACFNKCLSLSSVSIPSSVSRIGEMCFCRCINLTNFIIDPQNKYYMVEDGIIYNKEKREIVEWVYCNKIRRYNVPSSIREIYDDCFLACSSLTSITIPSGVSRIGKGCFWGCSSLSSINIPASVSEIGRGCF